MINRVLIRMKTVQLLYSYLLVEKPFSIESQPSSPTKEKRFAYNLYLELLYLMVRLASNVKGKNKSLPLLNSRFILKIEKDDRLKSFISQYSGLEFPFSRVLEKLAESIKESLLFQEYEKNRDKGLNIDNFWENVFKSIIMTNPDVNEIIAKMPGYSLSGVERMRAMMEVTFKNFYSSKDNIAEELRTLERSMQKARDLYMRLLALPVELTYLRKNQLEQNRHKFLATTQDLNPNMRLVNNLMVKEIELNQTYIDYVEKNHLSWRAEDPELLDIILKNILDSEIYKNYESEPKNEIHKDSQFWQDVLLNLILDDKDFLEFLEDKSVFWNDDLEIMSSFVLKTFKRLENPAQVSEAVMPMYKDGIDGKDSRFGAELFQYVVSNKEVYRKYIEEALQHEKWETDRLAFMDVVITMTALAEILNYPEIPVNVSINEYIEIAKSYSSAKSGQFVHGLLASILPKLKEDGILTMK